MADTAIHIPGGAVEGIEAGTADVEGAMQEMGSAGMGGASKGFAKSSMGASSSGDGGMNIVVNFNGTREDFPDLESRIADLFERMRNLAPRTT